MSFASIGKNFGVWALLLMCSCKPDEALQTVGDIQTVVDHASVVISIVQSTPAGNKQEPLEALTFAEAASRAAWLSVSESNSKDPLIQRNEKIIGYFAKVPLSADRFADPNLKAGEEQLTGSIKLLLGRLQSNRAALASHPGLGDQMPEANSEGFTGRLNAVRQRAIDNISAANSLIQRWQQ